jgi:hypothetical protein
MNWPSLQSRIAVAVSTAMLAGCTGDAPRLASEPEPAAGVAVQARPVMPVGAFAGAHATTSLSTARGEIQAGGAFTCDFGLPLELPMQEVGPVLERDRMFMAERPGILHKHIPIRPDPVAQRIWSGGRYLFTTEGRAREYFTWVRTRFVLDGTPFFEREELLEPDCRAWRVVGAFELAPIRTAQWVLRTERWRVAVGTSPAHLESLWPLVLAAAEARELSMVWLLHAPEAALVSLVYFADRPATAPPDAGLLELEAAPPLGEVIATPSWSRVFDRTHWVLSIWFPYVFADRGEPSLWPNSPPLPEPFIGDGVCVPSRGEDHQSAPQDCPLLCGNGIADPGETNVECPSDVRTLH